MSNVDQKWRVNREKVEYLKRFPGLILDIHEAKGKTLEDIVVIDSNLHAVLFADGSFFFFGNVTDELSTLQLGFAGIRSFLAQHHSEALQHFEELQNKDEYLKHASRKEKLLDAISNNIRVYPELIDDIASLVETLKENAPQCDIQESDDQHAS